MKQPDPNGCAGYHNGRSIERLDDGALIDLDEGGHYCELGAGHQGRHRATLGDGRRLLWGADLRYARLERPRTTVPDVTPRMIATNDGTDPLEISITDRGFVPSDPTLPTILIEPGQTVRYWIAPPGPGRPPKDVETGEDANGIYFRGRLTPDPLETVYGRPDLTSPETAPLGSGEIRIRLEDLSAIIRRTWEAEALAARGESNLSPAGDPTPTAESDIDAVAWAIHAHRCGVRGWDGVSEDHRDTDRTTAKIVLGTVADRRSDQ